MITADDGRVVSRFPRWVYGVALVAFCLTILVGWLLGALAAPRGETIDWSVAAVAATAFATIALAGGTFVLAAGTLADAGASKQLVKLTARDMDLRDRPTIVVTGFDIHADRPICEISFENIGLAPAAYITAQVTGLDSSGEPVLTTGPISVGRVIRSGAGLDIALPFSVRGNFADWQMTELLTASLDRRGKVSHSLWRRSREGHTFLAASDFFTNAASDFFPNWSPDESLLERLQGEPQTPMAIRESGGEWLHRRSEQPDESATSG